MLKLLNSAVREDLGGGEGAGEVPPCKPEDQNSNSQNSCEYCLQCGWWPAHTSSLVRQRQGNPQIELTGETSHIVSSGFG